MGFLGFLGFLQISIGFAIMPTYANIYDSVYSSIMPALAKYCGFQVSIKPARAKCNSFHSSLAEQGNLHFSIAPTLLRYYSFHQFQITGAAIEVVNRMNPTATHKILGNLRQPWVSLGFPGFP